jgi:hypothetical protein
MKLDLKEIFNSFYAEGSFSAVVTCGSGHIHDTYRIINSDKDKDDYILQRINNKVFKNVAELQQNIERVTRHIQHKLSQIPGSDIKRESLTLIGAKDGRSWIKDENDNFWRLFVYITDHRSYDIVDSPSKAYEGGRAIGRFQAMLADLPGEPLHETIPFFHHIGKRLDTFLNSVRSNSAGRAAGVSEEIDFVLKRAEEMKTIIRLGNDGKIPLRITHNDTKFNNVLFDNNDKALCVIDLDTVMPGYVHYDFGDAIRTAANVASEDETDLSRIRMDIELYKAFSQGYLSEAKNTLNDVEKEYLAFSPKLITYTMAVRFLTDYLDGDIYYKIHHPNHNIDRARAQLKLVKSMEEQYDEMQRTIKGLI